MPGSKSADWESEEGGYPFFVKGSSVALGVDASPPVGVSERGALWKGEGGMLVLGPGVPQGVPDGV